MRSAARPDAQAARSGRRACATSTSTVPAKRTRARWPAWRSTCTGRSPRRARRGLFEGSGGYAAGEQRRDFVHVGDVVDVNLWFYEHAKVSGVFNVGTGASSTFNDVANAIIAWHGRGAMRYIPFPDELKSRYQSFTEADITALRSGRLLAAVPRRACGHQGLPRRARRPAVTARGQSASRRPFVGGRHGHGAGALQAVATAESRPRRFTSSRRRGRCRCSSECPRSRAASSSTSGTASSGSAAGARWGGSCARSATRARSCCRARRKPRSCRGSPGCRGAPASAASGVTAC